MKQLDFSKDKNREATILIAQPSWQPGQLRRDSNQLFKLELTRENQEFIDLVLGKGKSTGVDLIVFPEFAIPEQCHEKVRSWTLFNKAIVVAGSTYIQRDGEHYNTASVFFEGIQYKTEKQILSPHEVSGISGYGPSGGTDCSYFCNTPVGNLALMICADEFDAQKRHDLLTLDLDILCVIAAQSKGKEHHQSIDRIMKEDRNGIYVVYCNALCDSICDGRSAFFGNDYSERFVEFKEAGLTSNDGIDRRLVEMPHTAGCLIVKCSLVNKKVTFPNLDPGRSLVETQLPFVFECGCLRQLTLEETRRQVKTNIERQADYQPAIPPVKSFAADYVGRQADIAYLNDFLGNSQEHFLLLYGVGGMGKSHLLYCCLKNYKGKPFFYHPISQDENFDLNKFCEVCLLPKPDDKLSLEERLKMVVGAFQENNIYLILDDYYEVQMEEVKSLLPKLIGIGKGKIIVLSRVIPSNISHSTNDFLNHKVPPLDETSFCHAIKKYARDKSVNLTEEEIHLIFEKAQGYPLGGQLIIDAKPYCVRLGELLSDLPKFEADIDPEGKDYSGRLLNKIFQGGAGKEIELLCEFSALSGASNIETVRQLPSFDLSIFQGLHRRKGFVDMDAQGRFSSHAMIKDFAYHRLQRKNTLHLLLGRYFEHKITGRTDADWEWLNESIFHYKRTNREDLSSFKHRVEKNFESRNIKGFVERNSINTIRNCATLINLYPDKPAYYNELGIAYRQNKQRANAIETFLRALEIESDNVKVLNGLGITYRENNQKTKAIETFLRALEIDPKALPSLNELGITYRENNQTDEAIETFLCALEIDPKHLPSLNELGITYRENNQKNKAIEIFLGALEIESDNVKVLNGLGITYRENNQKTKAIETFLRALEIDPKALPSLNELGITYRENNQKTKAIEIFLGALEIESDNVKVLNGLGITYRENNQKTKAIETFLGALEIDPKALPSLNELGITYRENNQKTKAIETFLRALEIDPKALPSLNELGITYRENNQTDEAIEVCGKAAQISKQRQQNLNLLQIYLFFSHDEKKAKENYDSLMISPRLRAFNSTRKKYDYIIRNMDSILNVAFGEVAEYEPFLFLAIQYKAYSNVLPLLMKLDDQFPDNSRLKSRLGKTLSNNVIGQTEMGWNYIKQAIQLFKKENNVQQVQHHIFYYLYGLASHGRMELLEREFKVYATDLTHDADYFRFMAHYSFTMYHDIEGAIAYFEKAVAVAGGLTEKRMHAESLLRFLSEQNILLYRGYLLKFEELL